jgi:hypothetical protein
LSVYLDASVIIPTLVTDSASATVEAFLLANVEEIVVSDFCAAEVASAFSRLVRTGDLTTIDASARLAVFDQWCALDAQMVDVEPADIRATGALVRQFHLMLRAPDALHIVITRRLTSTMVTRDQRMARVSAVLGLPTILL